MRRGAGRAPRRIYVTDCAAPLTRNGNAQQIAERFSPDGAEFFARLSKYDDFLADVVRRPGYNAGDTLRLLPPFLKAFEVTDDGVEAFSAEGVLVAAVRPVGGGMKLAALEESVAAEGVEGAAVMYVGDSITDAPTLADVKAWGGVSLSFNGNGYALAAAEFAAASPDAGVAAELAKAFAGGGRDGVEAAVRAWPKPKKGEKPTGRAGARVGLVAEEPEALAEASAAARRSVRGERIARLG